MHIFAATDFEGRKVNLEFTFSSEKPPSVSELFFNAVTAFNNFFAFHGSPFTFHIRSAAIFNEEECCWKTLRRSTALFPSAQVYFFQVNLHESVKEIEPATSSFPFLGGYKQRARYGKNSPSEPPSLSPKVEPDEEKKELPTSSYLSPPPLSGSFASSPSCLNLKSAISPKKEGSLHSPNASGRQEASSMDSDAHTPRNTQKVKFQGSSPPCMKGIQSENLSGSPSPISPYHFPLTPSSYHSSENIRMKNAAWKVYSPSVQMRSLSRSDEFRHDAYASGKNSFSEGYFGTREGSIFREERDKFAHLMVLPVDDVRKIVRDESEEQAVQLASFSRSGSVVNAMHENVY